MQIFSVSNPARHAPKWYVADGVVRPCPDNPERVLRILKYLSGPIMEAATDPWPALRAIHRADYLKYLQTIHEKWTAEFGDCDVIPDTFVPRRAGTPTPCPSKPVAQAGYYCFDMAAPITAGTFDAVFDGAKCAVSAANAVLGGKPAAYALCRPPGHHAGPDYCGGFCYLNNAAAAAQHLRMKGMSRVAILDVDYHQGNGTQDIFYARDDVLFISIHADPNAQFPYFWGHADEMGMEKGLGFNHNLPLPRGTSEQLWMETFARAVALVPPFKADGLVISLGVDTSAQDTVGDFRLSPMAFWKIGCALAALNLPTLFVQEGGYNLDDIGPSVANVLEGFETSATK